MAPQAKKRDAALGIRGPEWRIRVGDLDQICVADPRSRLEEKTCGSASS
jgi:hypothetical protein